MPARESKGRLSKVKAKTCRWHVFSPWEIPAGFGTQSGGLWTEIGKYVGPLLSQELFFIMFPLRKSKRLSPIPVKIYFTFSRKVLP